MSQQTRQDQVPQELLRDDVDAGSADGTAGTAVATPRDPEDIATRWRDIQATFVDDPRAAVRHADALVAEAMDRVARTMSDRRGTLGHSWSEESTSTEDLRTCLQGYRTLLERVSAIHV